ncbi:MAG TPA: diacylglycerol kinase family protein [Vicinamibacterales bacterium]|nr:diacylglycerol kinase family protein [Vicinamibacterales bacterium]
MRVALFHNEDAGDGSSIEEITALLERHGHDLVQVVDKEHRVEHILASHADLAVAAGGDGTVATAARVLAGHTLPLAILPLGTANNIARSLSNDGPLDTLVEAWGRTTPQLLDIGFARAEWGQRIFFESVGAGLIPAGIAAAKAQEEKAREGSPTVKPEDAIATFRDVLARLEPQRWTLVIDGQEEIGDFLLVEVLNIASIGPNLVLSDEANPNDGLFSVIIAAEQHRRMLDEYLAHRANGGERPLSMPPRHARRVEIRGSTTVHVDDQLLDTHSPETVSMTIEAGALKFLPGPTLAP